MTFNVDSFPQAGKTINILNATTSVGGKGANQAVGAAKIRQGGIPYWTNWERY